MTGSRAVPRVLAAWIAALVALALAGPAAAGTVVVLRSRSLPAFDASAAGFRAAYHDAIDDLSLEAMTPELVERRIAELRPDAVVAIGLRAALFAHARLPRVPLVFCGVQPSEHYRLAGVRATGIAAGWSPESDLAALRAAAPDVRRVLLFHAREGGDPMVRQARRAAAAAGLTLVEAPLGSLSDLASVARAAEPGVDALWMPADPMIATPEAFRFLLDLSLASRKPLLVFSDALVRAGALVASAPDYGVMGARAADAVRRIQAGDRAGDIPIVLLKTGRVVVNQSTARALGRKLPAELARTAEVLP